MMTERPQVEIVIEGIDTRAKARKEIGEGSIEREITTMIEIETEITTERGIATNIDEIIS